MNARREYWRRRIIKQRHKLLPAQSRQHALFCEPALVKIAARQVIECAFGNGDAESLFDAKEQIEHVHRGEAEVIEKKLLWRNDLVIRERKSLAHERRDVSESRGYTHAV